MKASSPTQGACGWLVEAKLNKLCSICCVHPPLHHRSLSLLLHLHLYRTPPSLPPSLHPSLLSGSSSPPPGLPIPAAVLISDVGRHLLIVADGVWEGHPEATHGPQSFLQLGNLHGGVKKSVMTQTWFLKCPCLVWLAGGSILKLQCWRRAVRRRHDTVSGSALRPHVFNVL